MICIAIYGMFPTCSGDCDVLLYVLFHLLPIIISLSNNEHIHIIIEHIPQLDHNLFQWISINLKEKCTFFMMSYGKRAYTVYVMYA